MGIKDARYSDAVVGGQIGNCEIRREPLAQLPVVLMGQGWGHNTVASVVFSNRAGSMMFE